MTPWTKRLAIGLSISVAINLLLCGFLLGRSVRRGPAHKPDVGMHENAPELRHPMLRRAIEGRRGELVESRKATQAVREAVRDALTKEPFDPALLEHALQELRGQTGRSQEVVHKALLDAAVKGTPETRRELARTFAKKRGPMLR
jgi:uncharacterized membrane protein